MAKRTKQESIDAFWKRFDQPEQGCWNYKEGTEPGYDSGSARTIQWEGRGHPIARVAYSVSREIPIDELGPILHSCDNGYCGRPDHLREGTNSDNQKDRALRYPESFIRHPEEDAIRVFSLRDEG